MEPTPLGEKNVPQEDLSTRVLELEGPIWAYGGNHYEARQMATQIVDFLMRLKENSVDRRDNPTIARFETQKVVVDPSSPLCLQLCFNSNLREMILKEAARRGLDVAFITSIVDDESGGKKAVAVRADRFNPRKKPDTTRSTSIKDRIEDGIKHLEKIFKKTTQQQQQEEEEPKPSFILMMSLDYIEPATIDTHSTGGYTTSGYTWSYNTLLHKVSIVNPEDFPRIKYEYYHYGDEE